MPDGFSVRTLPYGALPAEEGDLYIPAKRDGKTPLALAIHGGGFRAGKREDWAGVVRFLAVECGFAVYNIDYPLSGRGENLWPLPVQSTERAAHFLLSERFKEEYPFFEDKIAIVGGSAGGFLALWAGLSLKGRAVKQIVSVSGIADPLPDFTLHPGRYENFFGKSPDAALLESAFPPVPEEAEEIPPILFTHAIEDEVVPLASPMALIEKLRLAGGKPETYFYSKSTEESEPGHSIYRKGDEERRLTPLLEKRIKSFLLGRKKRSPVGIGFEMLDRELFDPGRAYDAVDEGLFSHARCQTGWSRCEKQKGVYSFEWLDSVVDNLSARAIEPWFNVGFGNVLYMQGCHTKAAVGCVPLYYGEECLRGWTNFIKALAARYRERVHHWEIWNEPDIESFWQPEKPSAKEYARLVEMTSGIIKGVIPDAKIGACVSVVLNKWLEELIPLVADKIDFFCIHPYNTIPEMARGEQRNPDGTACDFTGQIEIVRGLFAKAGNGKVELWNGEAGYPSWFPANHWLLGKNEEGLSSERIQAKWVLRRFVADRMARLARSCHFCTVDLGAKPYSMATTTQTKPARHGILDMDYRKKAVLGAIRSYNLFLGEAEFLSSGDNCINATVALHTAIFALPDKSRILCYHCAGDPLEETPENLCARLENRKAEDCRLFDPIENRWIGARTDDLPLFDYPLFLLLRGS